MFCSNRKWLTLVLAAFCLLAHQPAQAVIRDGGIDPANLGKGDWIYSIKDATNRLGGHVLSVTNEVSLMQFYKGKGIRYIIIKMGTGSTNYGGCYASPNQLTANFCNIARTNGVWVFGYTRSYGDDIAGESALADYCFNVGADGFVFDAEAEWESGHLGTNGPALAWQLCSMVRSNWPNKFLAHAPFPIIYLHSSFPYKEFGYWCDAVMPQIYHFSATGIKGSPSAAINWSDVNWRTWQNSLVGSSSVINGETIYWTNSIKPIATLQDVYGPGGTIAPGTTRCNATTSAYPDKDVMEFIDYSAADPNCVTVGGYNGVNFWRADLHGPLQFTNIGAGTSGYFSNIVNNIVLDDAAASVTGAWAPIKVFGATTTTPTYYGETGSDTNSFGTNYWRIAQGVGAAYMQFTPNVVEAGDYNIYQWHPYRADASTNVPFVINHAAGSAMVFANQQTNYGNWSFVGRFPFAKGTAGTIRVMDNFPEATAVAMVDGLKMTFVIPASVPAAPSLLTATAVSSSQIDLRWTDNSTNETAFVVLRSTVNGGPYNAVATVPINATNYSDTGLSPATTYYYVVKSTNYLGASPNSNQASATTSSAQAPTITAQPQSQSVPLNGNATFSVTASGSAPLLYQWRFQGSDILLATGSSYTRSNVQSSDAGGYSVVVQNSFGSVTSAVATLTVVLPPSITSQPQSRTNNAGTTATFSVTANGTNLTFTWFKGAAALSDGGNISGATTATLSVASVTQADAANYTVVVTNIAGSITSSPASLTVIDPPSITLQPQNQTVSVGDNVIFTVDAAGTPPLNYQWRFNGVPIPNATDTSYSLTDVQGSDAGNYSVLISNTAGSASSVNAALTVLGSGAPVIRLTNIWNIQAGSRNYVTTGTTERGIALNRFTSHVLVVSRSASVPGSLGIFVLDADTGTDVSALSLNGVTNNATFKLNKIGVAEDGAIYADNLTTASGTSPFIIYRWSSESADPVVAYSGAPDGGVTARWGDSFAVKGSGTNTRIIVSSSTATNWIVFTTSDGTNFVANKINPSPSIVSGECWGGLYFGEGDTFFHKNRTNGLVRKYSYNLAANSASVATDFVPIDSNMVAIAVDTNRNLLFGVSDNNTTNHLNHSLITYDLSNPASPSVVSNFYFLSFGTGTNSANSNFAGAADTDGTRIVGLDTQNGVVALKMALLNPPTIATQPVSQTVNAGQTGTFTVSAGGDAPLSYQWKKNGVPVSGPNISGATTPTLTIGNVSQSDAGNYSVVVTNFVGMVASDSVTLTVNDPPTITAQPVSQTQDAGSIANFSVSVSGTPPFTYQWRKNGVDLSDDSHVSGATTSSLTINNVLAADAAAYTVRVANVADSIISDPATLTVNDPVINSAPQSVTNNSGTTAGFSVTATGTQPLTYQWKKGNVNLADG